MEIYLDNSATTKCYPEAAELAKKVMCIDYGNPSSLHKKGFAAQRYVDEAKENLAKILKVSAGEIYFTSGGTESDNLALMGCAHALKRAGNHLITTAIEHPAVLRTMRRLEEEGFKVTYLPVNAYGRIDLGDLKNSLCPETVLVSIMYLNNEIGTVEPVKEAAELVKAYSPSILFHTDAVQGFGKYRIYPKRMGIDLLSVSAHKIHGPKGVGFLYIDRKVKIQPILFGGGQQKNIRSGTENVPGISALGLAAKMAYENLDEKTNKMRELKVSFREGLIKIKGVLINSPAGELSAPHILSVGFSGVSAEALLHALEDQNIFVSSGSACSSHHPGVSHVLQAIGTKEEYLKSTIRFSMSEFTTREEIDYTLETLYNCIPALRRFTRR